MTLCNSCVDVKESQDSSIELADGASDRYGLFCVSNPSFGSPPC